MQDNIQNLMTLANNAKMKFQQGLITYEEAGAAIQPYLDIINAAQIKLAKKYSIKEPRNIGLAGFLR